MNCNFFFKNVKKLTQNNIHIVKNRKINDFKSFPNKEDAFKLILSSWLIFEFSTTQQHIFSIKFHIALICNHLFLFDQVYV
jgi:hypothetical protein